VLYFAVYAAQGVWKWHQMDTITPNMTETRENSVGDKIITTQFLYYYSKTYYLSLYLTGQLGHFQMGSETWVVTFEGFGQTFKGELADKWGEHFCSCRWGDVQQRQYVYTPIDIFEETLLFLFLEPQSKI
jgi:hypothetical protein